jgi:hypothetical protein
VILASPFLLLILCFPHLLHPNEDECNDLGVKPVFVPNTFRPVLTVTCYRFVSVDFYSFVFVTDYRTYVHGLPLIFFNYYNVSVRVRQHRLSETDVFLYNKIMNYLMVTSTKVSDCR